MGTQRVKIYQEPEKKEKPRTTEDKEKEQPAKKEEVKPKLKARPAKIRGKKWQEAIKMIDKGKIYSIPEALELLKKISYSKFDSSVEVHIRLNPKKGQTIRGTLFLPHGLGKEPKVAIYNVDLLPQIEKGKIDFDLLLAKPEDMPSLAKVAKILGPKGLMPNPKSGTITDKPEEAIKKIKSGQIEYKADAQNNLHQMIGKISWESKKLEENLKAVIEAIRQYNPVSVTICTTMSPGIKVSY